MTKAPTININLPKMNLREIRRMLGISQYETIGLKCDAIKMEKGTVTCSTSVPGLDATITIKGDAIHARHSDYNILVEDVNISYGAGTKVADIMPVALARLNLLNRMLNKKLWLRYNKKLIIIPYEIMHAEANLNM